MASLSKQQLTVLLYGKLYLPALSLALLTGFTFSMPLSSPLQALIPAMESLFLVSLPHLWQASLSWLTPPALFLLLNGIIMILTATSGRFSRPPPSPTNFPAKMEKSTTCKDVVASIESASASPSPIVPHSVDINPPEIALPVLQSEGPVVPFIDIPLSHHCLHAQDTIMEELPEEVLFHGGFNDDDDDNKKDVQIIFQEALQQTVDDTVVDKLEIDGSNDPFSSSCEEVLKGGSEPSSPKYSSSSPAMKDNMRRSLSIDSAPCIDNVEASPEYNLSEEAFKKRIEDYIFKVNAKLRSETRFI